IEVEGDSLDEVVEGLETFPEWLAIIDNLVTGLEGAPSAEEERPLEGIVELSSDGPLITVPRDRLTDREAIAILLYANDPEPLEPKDIGRLLRLSGRPSAGYGSRLSEMRREGYIIRDGGAYRLSAAGKRWAEEEVVSKLKG
ncbi:MAG: hypothetical protein ACE5Z5_12410, partial [Candidatus Bathyarchaeia archaeon]